MSDELLRAYRDRAGSAAAIALAPTPQITLATVNPAPQPEPTPDPLPDTPESETVEEYGCFATARGQAVRGFKVRLRDRYFSCQYLAFIRTGEQSGWDADLGKEVLYVIFHWGTLVIAGKALDVLDELLNDHKLARLSLGEGSRGVWIDDIRILAREAAQPSNTKRRS